MTPETMGARQALTAATLLSRYGLTLATAESLTGGLVGQLVTSVAGASAFYVGGMITYATEAKSGVLGVDPAVLREQGPVSPEVARQMAARVRVVFGASMGLATTGVAGPTEQDGNPVGMLHVGIADATGTRAITLKGPDGSRAEVRAWAAQAALTELVGQLLRTYAVEPA
ncbi:CinA family protein [Phytohabitans houttuyneae]|uniref:Competence damage-inducible protein A n=1 Tax=Phytohabitans houttuyneae TaxID=1076126 RepID=A0A6V8JWW1_9ACTN|nr:CinA family protein [Phytohabitans houttuyneae]GFJ77152.1 competence damage-inducible protein A [Phytohabitans houttuyneae]